MARPESMAEEDLPNASQNLDMLEAQLQQYLARPSFWLKFPAEIDRRFEDQGRAIRLKRFLKVGWASLLFFDLLAFSDYFVLPEHYQIAWTIRFLLVTPPALVLLFLLPRSWMAPWRGEALSGLLLIAAGGLSVMAAYMPSTHNELFYFQWLLLVLTGNLLFRLRFRVAIPASALLWLIFVFTVVTLVEKTPALSIISIILMSVVLAISLIAKHRMELDNRVSYALKILHKITQLRLERANKKLVQQASRDGLTGIYNRRALDDTYERLWRHAVRRQRPLSVLFIDVDHFKRYNDTYGHAAGDECLCWLAELLQNAARRPLDFAARFGGEEFCVVLPDTLPDEAGVIAEQIRARVISAQRPHAGNTEGCVTVSIGVAGGIPENGEAVTLYIEQADGALYVAKAQGRNRVRYARENNSS